MSHVTDFISGLWSNAEGYGVDPAVFVTLYLVTWPLWYYSMWWVASGWHRRDRNRMRAGIWSNRIVTIAPYAYVLAAGGKGMPWTWYAFVIVLPAATTSIFLHKVRNEEWMDKWWNFYNKQLNRFHLNAEN